MKVKIKNWINPILITATLLIAGLVLYSVTVYQKDYPDYSTYNAKGTGTKALYLVAREMGFNVERYHYPAKFIKDISVMIVYRPDYFFFNQAEEKESLRAWLLKGNTMVLIPDYETLNELWIFDMISEHKKDYEVVNTRNITITWYTLDSGTVCVIDRPDSFLNANLSESDGAVEFVNVLERIGEEKVVFNEYYLGFQKAAPGVWELIGRIGQLVVFQLSLAMLLFIIRGWEPFGRDRTEWDWVRRPENEVLKALSGLYIRMKAYPLVLSNYYGYITQKYRRFLSIPSPLQDRLARTLAICSHYIERNGRSKKELFYLVQQINKLESQINKYTAKDVHRKGWKIWK